MTGVRTVKVEVADVEIRLDRWFKRHFPDLSHGRLEKLLRTGQVRVDGRRAKAGQRIKKGQVVRVPPMEPHPQNPTSRRSKVKRVDSELARELARRVLHMDDDVLALDKPPGLAVQGGTGTKRHIDGALDELRFDSAERPRLVHRLDKDTSGVLLLARSARAARWLTQAFRYRSAIKTYWAAVVGEPRFSAGTIDLPVAKLAGHNGDKMAVDWGNGRRAVTDYVVLEQLGRRVAWMAMRPLTGRTHQLRVHMASLGTPVLGDGKYGGEGAFLGPGELSPKLHLHARSILVRRPDHSCLSVNATLPEHMVHTWSFLGFDLTADTEPFLGSEVD
ncbi:MAG: RNA pseudouridine synthase [Rhodospirillaceae bacterium]|nr:RNA pseudouridine synthase [Rhodospirillaceae bacterium]